MRAEMPRFAYDIFYPEGWQARQRAGIATLLADPDAQVWVAQLDGLVAGFVAIKLHPEDRMGEIFVLAVAPQFQRQKIARRLTDHAEAMILAAGMAMVMVETGGESGHLPARLTYEAAGYERWSVARYFKPLQSPSQ